MKSKGGKFDERYFYDVINELAIDVNKKLQSAVRDLFYSSSLGPLLAFNLDSLELYLPINGR